MNDNGEYLVHHGVMGMKWGVRKQDTKSSGGRSSGGHKKQYSVSNEPNKVKKAKRKGPIKRYLQKLKRRTPSKRTIKKMSDEELRQKITRLELEHKYKRLVKEDRTTFGEKLVADILGNSAKNVGGQLTTYTFGSAVNKVAGEEVVNPRKGQKDKK